MDDKELSGAEEEKEVEKALQKPLISLEDLVRISSLEGSGAAGDSLRALLQRGQDTSSAEWSAFEHANIGPYIQKMIAAATPFKGDYQYLRCFICSFLFFRFFMNENFSINWNSKSISRIFVYAKIKIKNHNSGYQS